MSSLCGFLLIIKMKFIPACHKVGYLIKSNLIETMKLQVKIILLRFPLRYAPCSTSDLH